MKTTDQNAYAEKTTNQSAYAYAEKTIELSAYAKINLSLNVLDKRPDGYHNIETIFHQIDLSDTVTISIGSGNTGDSGNSISSGNIRDSSNSKGSRNKRSSWQETCVEVSVSAKDAYLIHMPDNCDNLAALAAKLFLRHCQPENVADIRIHIDKRIPTLAGLGGGSADAAAVFLGLARLTGIKEREKLHTLAMLSEEIGADTPFCFFGQTALNPALGYAEILPSSTCAFGEGKGGSLTMMPPLKAWSLLVKPDAALSTKKIYEQLHIEKIVDRPDTKSIIAGLINNDYDSIVDSMVNVLEIPALMEYPKIGQIKKQIVLSGADKALMSGSGSTVFGLYRDGESCGSAAKWLAGLLPDCEIMTAALL